MRRQQFKSEQSYIDWLKSKGCRFYAPMDEEHGTDELIQGWTFSVNNGCSCVWDSNKRAHLITGSSSSSKASAMWSGKSIQSQNVGEMAINTQHVLLCDFNLTSSGSWTPGASYGGSDDYTTNISGTSSSRNVLCASQKEFYTRNGKSFSYNIWYTYFQWYNKSNSRRCDITAQGITLLEADSNPSWTFVYNQNCDTHVSLMAGCSGYVRNLYIFATALSDEDIMTIYRHDHQ
ncbi:MAG: hypothetical protein II859_10395 [Bacteroidales bacterium]|nr:hypothetical protein [Bacteroidales bacterium]